MAKKKDKHTFPRWLDLYVYSNCFNDDDKTHLGIRFRGEYYCITHLKNNGIEIPKKYLKMKVYSNKNEYFKKCNTTPNVIHKTSMKINEAFIVDFLLTIQNNKL